MNLTYNTVTFNLTEGVGHLILNRPPSNRMSLKFFSEMDDLVKELRGRKELRSIVISGQGRHFSSGADLDELTGFLNGQGNAKKKEIAGTTLAFMERNIRTFRYFSESGIPVIAAIRGVCLGSALELALFCHFRFCGEDALFGLPESTFSLMPGIGGVSGMAALVGTAKAIELTIKGNTFDATEALNIGLADKIIPKRNVVAYALHFASGLPENYHKEKSSLYLRRTFADA